MVGLSRKTTSNFDPAARNAHTHHITMCGVDVTKTSTGGIQVSGPAAITLNGNAAPVSPSVLTIAITGGTDVEFSNITLTFDPRAPTTSEPNPCPEWCAAQNDGRCGGDALRYEAVGKAPLSFHYIYATTTRSPVGERFSKERIVVAKS